MAVLRHAEAWNWRRWEVPVDSNQEIFENPSLETAMGFSLFSRGRNMNTTSTERRPDAALRPENQFELLRQVYEDVRLETEYAQEAARADLVALYVSPWNLE